MIRNLLIAATASAVVACVPAGTPENPKSSASISSASAPHVTSSEAAEPPSSAAVVSSSSAAATNTGAGVIFTEDFESGSNGQVPAGWQTFTGYVPNQSNANQSLSVDTTRAHSGSKSLKVKGDANQPSQILKKLPGDIDQLYMRAWFYMSRKLGNDPSDNHEHIMGTRKDSGGDRAFASAEAEIRIGQGKGHLGYSLPSIGDAISPPDVAGQFPSSGGPQTPTNEWFCVEAGFDPSQPYDELYMWVNDSLVNSVEDASDWHTSVGSSWMNGLLGYAFFGWHSFSGHSTEMWIDDIVVSSEPIGCN